MINFVVFKKGQQLKEVDVRASYMVGPEDVPINAEISCRNGLLTCKKFAAEAGGLALLWTVPGCGMYMVQTTRLVDRDQPYILNVEIARWRLMRLMQKLEDWALFDYPKAEPIRKQIAAARDCFVHALQSAENPAKAAELADESLKLSIGAGEILARFHSQMMLGPRLQQGKIGRKIFGVRLDPQTPVEAVTAQILEPIDYVEVPIKWSEIQPAQGQFNFAGVNRTLEYLLKRKVTVKLTSVIRLHESYLPEWLKKSNLGFEGIRDLVYSYLSHVANRYGKYIRSWTILSGIHCENYFNLNFDQILELTRLIAVRAKQVCPRASTMIEILWPWGEYYAQKPRTIHPFLYADLLSQSGINFDAFSLKMLFGAAVEGMYTRDMFQISSMIDHYAVLGKPLHLVVAAPSQADQNAGFWTKPWTPKIQAKWFETFCKIALSKPQVDSITWDNLADVNSPETIPYSGLLGEDMKAKEAFNVLRELQRKLSNARASAKDILQQ